MQGNSLGIRRFGRINWLGLQTLAMREISRFMGVWTQTLLAPLVTTALFMAIFTLAIGSRRGEVMGVPFHEFLLPGVMMMAVIQNAFANTSSSVIIAKVQGNIVDTLMPPLSPMELVLGYLAGAVLRGLMVAVAVTLAAMVVLGTSVAHPIWALTFVLLGGAFMGALGLIAAIYANKFDQMAAITNFVVTPLSFLSGTFYSVEALPPLMRTLSHGNPFFYLIDGVRFGMIGQSDASPWLGLLVGSGATAVVILIAWWMFRRGYRMKP